MYKLTILLSIISIIVADINFLAIGDWGGESDDEPFTEPQRESSIAMNMIASQLNADFFVALGDNFYHDGVTNVESARFQETFESIYSGQSLQKKWYAIPGNHDYNGNVSAQIEYTKNSSRWIFPNEYHSHYFESSDGISLDLILIDTVNLAGQYIDPIVGEEEVPLILQSRSYATSQWDWLETKLAASTANYILIGGHYPVYSVCEHGSTPTLKKFLKPLLVQYGAHYMAGHDHCMEHLQEDEIHHFLTGMGKECCYKNTRMHDVPEDTLKWYIAANNAPSSVTAGFTSFTLTKDFLTATFYDQSGNTLYATPQIPPRI